MVVRFRVLGWMAVTLGIGSFLPLLKGQGKGSEKSLPLGASQRLGTEPRDFVGRPVQSACLSPDGKLAAAFPLNERLLKGRGEAGPLKVLDVASGKPSGLKAGRPLAGDHGAFSPDAKWFAAVEGTGFHLVNLQTGAVNSIGMAEYPQVIEFSRDGRIISIGAFQVIHIYETSTREPLH